MTETRTPPAATMATLLVAATLFGCAGARGPAGPYMPHDGIEGEGVLGEWVHSGGYRRDYILSLAEGLEASRPAPLLLVMHGAGATADGLHRWIDPDSATEAAGFVTVYPDGLDNSWNIGCPACTSAAMQGVDDVAFVNTLIDHLADSLPIDTTRIYMAGHSLGAQFAHFYACASERTPRAISALSGLWLRRTAVRCTPGRPLSVQMIHGDRDRILPWDGPRRNASALSMPEAWERWYDILECTDTPTERQRPDEAGDGTHVESESVSGCDGGSAIELHRLVGAGHGWPGPGVAHAPPLGPHTANFDGLSELLRFFTGPGR